MTFKLIQNYVKRTPLRYIKEKWTEASLEIEIITLVKAMEYKKYHQWPNMRKNRAKK